MPRRDAQAAFYAVPQPLEADCYAIECASGTTAYADLPSGFYDCFSPDAAAGEHFRFCYLSMEQDDTPTIAYSDFPAPTAADYAQASGVPTGATGACIVPANASPIRLFVHEGYRLAILYSDTGPVTLFCSKVK